MNQFDKGTAKLIIVGLVFGLLLYSAFEYNSWLAGIGAFISFWVIMVEE